MWIYTTHGFFSVVAEPIDWGQTEKGTYPERNLVVRSRSLQHLKNLRNQFIKNEELFPIEEGTGTDYPFRIRMTREDWVDLSADLARDIDYTNFKNEASVMDNYGESQLYLVYEATMGENDVYREAERKDLSLDSIF